jgi:hypothetical protein
MEGPKIKAAGNTSQHPPQCDFGIPEVTLTPRSIFGNPLLEVSAFCVLADFLIQPGSCHAPIAFHGSH